MSRPHKPVGRLASTGLGSHFYGQHAGNAFRSSFSPGGAPLGSGSIFGPFGFTGGHRDQSAAAAWIQQQRNLGAVYLKGLKDIGAGRYGPGNTNASGGFGSNAFAQIESGAFQGFTTGSAGPQISSQQIR